MVLTSSGEVLTNNHVIRGATSIKIAVPGTNHTYTAKVVGYDVADDVAVLQAAGASNLNTIETAASSAVAVGDAVTAVGNADGTGKLTSATGSITGVQKAIVVSDDQGGTESLSGLIETDHLLLGMLNVRGALAGETLRALGVSPDALRASLLAYRAQAS